mmetsp:Transcript_14884/g.37697  ORF Transcript_14884/g.37697 Transcript_14884/m.37697 type:complete len:179 (+) Transcript_14884:140-676(+)
MRCLYNSNSSTVAAPSAPPAPSCATFVRAASRSGERERHGAKTERRRESKEGGRRGAGARHTDADAEEGERAPEHAHHSGDTSQPSIRGVRPRCAARRQSTRGAASDGACACIMEGEITGGCTRRRKLTRSHAEARPFAALLYVACVDRLGDALSRHRRLQPAPFLPPHPREHLVTEV